jgi:multidrug efflux pump subunit AcrA (membrane-fusion protein)
MRFLLLLFGGLGLVFASLPSQTAADWTKPISCRLALDEEAEIPAQEAGVLDKVLVREGQAVSKDELLAQIDDVIPKLQRDVASYKLEVAHTQANDLVDRTFAEASLAVANAEYRQAEEANAKVLNTVPQAEVLRRLLECRKMELSIDKANKDLTVAAKQALVAEGELQAAVAMIARRRLVAPFDAAVVVELKKHKGEWVQQGEPVMKLVRMDRLRVNGALDAKDYHLAEIKGRPVQVVVTLPNKREARFTGTIVYVKPIVEGKMFQVRAEIQNQPLDKGWLVYPGMAADMSIDMK